MCYVLLPIRRRRIADCLPQGRRLNLHTPKVRGVITVPSSKRFPTGKIDVDGGGADLLNECLLPYHLSRETRPCVRLISWSPAGLAKDAGSCNETKIRFYIMLTDFSFLLFWSLKVVNVSEVLYNYYKSTNFGECQIVPLEGSDVIPRQDTAKCVNRRIQKTANVVSEDHENLGEKNNWQIVSSSFYEGDPLEEVTEDCLPLISAQQYASRNEMLMSLIIAWSPILETSGNDVAFPSNSSNCCSILVVGGKCSKISLWRVRAPECYSTDNAGHASEVRLVGLEKTHDSWITTISWVRYGSNDSNTQFALVTGSSDGSVKIWLVNGEKLLKASEVINDSLSLLRVVRIASQCLGFIPWAFDGRCLYSCSQNNSLKSWTFVGDSLSEVPLSRSSPGLKSSTEFAHALDSCFGLSVSPGNLAVVVVRRYDSDLLDPMYEGRSHKSAVEFLWVGGQQLDPFVITFSEIAKETFPGFPEKRTDLLSEPSSSLHPTPKLRTMHSSRQLHRINIISREVVLKEFMTENVSGKEHVLEGSSCDKKKK
ncbi:hypothetical protein SASPL_150496 [Salvia splendens]|uniref:Uncharacterized protein n=1 Tax=Salvia splendens TaxID=180675 RepID=A0A8X8Z1T0_SALSN|nr:hypothetical protein SASPL_150496 [Salvia splendens]